MNKFMLSDTKYVNNWADKILFFKFQFFLHIKSPISFRCFSWQEYINFLNLFICKFQLPTVAPTNPGIIIHLNILYLRMLWHNLLPCCPFVYWGEDIQIIYSMQKINSGPVVAKPHPRGYWFEYSKIFLT